MLLIRVEKVVKYLHYKILLFAVFCDILFGLVGKIRIYRDFEAINFIIFSAGVDIMERFCYDFISNKFSSFIFKMVSASEHLIAGSNSL